ncbi:MAG: OmpH family outer membrane protein [Alphaproteobacteria bacterium]
MKNLLFICLFCFFAINLSAQESKDSKTKSLPIGSSNIGVVDMKKILAQSKAYQSLVDQFEDVRRKHRNKFTKQEDIIRDEESEILKQKNILSKEAYADKVKVLGKKINELKSKQAKDAKEFEVSFEKSTNKIQGALVDVLSILANSKKLNLVLAKSQVILVGKDIDLTDDAIAELNKVLPAIKLDK